MSVDRVCAYLEKRGLADRVMRFDVSSATVSLAAEAVGVEPARIAKTLSFALSGGCVLVVVAGDARIDNGRFKAQFGAKAKMLPSEEALRLTGYAVGGVCPFALPEGVPVYLDVSMQRFETVFPAAGDASSAVRLTPDEMFEHTQAVAWVDVCNGWKVPS